jgi:hypothetical protein
MSEKLIEFARRLQQRRWNRPGTDKTWVLQALSQHQKFAEEVRSAVRVAAR